mgnify:FL=1
MLNKPVKPLPFTSKELVTKDVRDTYKGEYLDKIAFPLGGIGTGSISLSGTGKLIDWEIFNNPNKGYQPRFSFLSVWAKEENEEPVFKVLEGQLTERLDGPMYLTPDMWYLGNGSGPQQTQAAGLPRMHVDKFVGRFPIAEVFLKDKKMPVDVKVKAWSPFIPGDDKNSSIPTAILNVSFKNKKNKKVKVTLGANMQNMAGTNNEIIREKDFYCLYLNDGKVKGKSMFIASNHPANTWQTNWKSEMVFMSLEHFARTFGDNGKFDENGKTIRTNKKERIKGNKFVDTHPQDDKVANQKVGSIGFSFELGPNETKEIPLVIGWYFPIFDTAEPNEVTKKLKEWKNYYATEWKNGLDVAKYVLTNFDYLESQTSLFKKSFFESTVPGVVLEAISTQLSVLRSTTMIRYPDGTLYGWEGCAPNKRLGYGTCNHVWHYQQAIPYLFPKVQRSILENFYNNGFRKSDGAISFRLPAGPGAKATDWAPRHTVDGKKTKYFTAIDGQLGMVCQVYRDWQISGNDKWLQKVWPRVKKSLEYTWTYWDKNKDGLLENTHHNTLDLDFHSPDPFCGSIYQAALLAGEKMANFIGDSSAAKSYREVFEIGKRNTDNKMFNGEYYHQLMPYTGDYQLGKGSISEQLHGELYSQMLGFESVYDSSNVKKALGSLFKYNFIEDFSDFVNVYRVYALGKESGIIIANWPNSKDRPKKPLLYADETMTGFEYQVAGNLLYSDYISEGLAVVKAIRDRYDGKKRNPYNEIEWGNHYVRTMSNYSSLLALSGFQYLGSKSAVKINPKVYKDNFKVFFSVESGWGMVGQKNNKNNSVFFIDVRSGTLKISQVLIKKKYPVKKVFSEINGKRKEIDYTTEKGNIIINLNKEILLDSEMKFNIKVYKS